MWTQATCALAAATAQHPLTLTSVLPVLPHQSASPSLPHRLSALSTHNGIFSSEKVDRSHIPPAVTIRQRSLNPGVWTGSGLQSLHLLRLCYLEHRHIYTQLQKEESWDLTSQSGTKYHSVPTRRRSHTIREKNQEPVQVGHVRADILHSPPHAHMSHSETPATECVPSAPAPLPI